MKDLIERQAAIDVLHMDTSIIPYEKAREYADATILEIRNRLEKLPSTQPEITPDGTLKVTVDADIASIGRILLSQAGTQRGGLYYKDEQPEIIRCRDCKHNPKYDWFGCPMSHLNEKQRPETAWCWKGERRTDEQTKD